VSVRAAAWAVAAMFGALAGIAGPARAQELQRFEFRQVVMAIEARIVLYATDEETAKGAVGAAFHAMERVDDIFSDYKPGSEVMRLCAAATATESDADRSFEPETGTLASVLDLCQTLAEASGGAFDVTCGPLTQLWRQARATGSLPTAAEIEAARSATGWRDLDVHAGSDSDQPTVAFAKRGMQLDLGAVAKGWALDVALAQVGRFGIESVMVEAGGDLRVGAPPPGTEGWTVNRRTASGSEDLIVRDAAVAVSGDENQGMDLDGVRYSHVVDPRTGWALMSSPSAALVLNARDFLLSPFFLRTQRLGQIVDCDTSATVLRAMPLAALADALSTGASILGAVQGLALAQDFGASKVRITDPAFTSLFDGQSLTGWTPRGGHYDGDAVWTVEDNCLVGATGAHDAGGLLYTATPHTSFEFQCEVQLEYPFDSGIFVRMAPEGRGLQLTLDDRPDGEVGGLYSDGWIEHAHPEAATAWKRGEWNHVFVRLTGFDMRLEAWINGVPVMDRVVPQEFAADGKPAFAPSGLIGLQVHGGGSEGTGHKVRFRDVQLRELPVFGDEWSTDRALSPPELGARNDAHAAGHWNMLLGSEDTHLEAWEAVDGDGDPRPAEDYVFAPDGALQIPARQPAGYLRTIEDFRDFDLRFDFRQARMSNSGLFLRARRESVGADGVRVPAGNPAYSGCEIQLLDDWNWESVTKSTLEPWQFTGSLYGAVPPARKGLLRPIGEWNTLEVLARGPRLACALNGQTVWDADTSKLAVEPPFAQRAAEGFIGLQRYAAPDVEGDTALAVRQLWLRRQ
jgi:thiamine biosynthesis lipoprotein